MWPSWKAVWKCGTSGVISQQEGETSERDPTCVQAPCSMCPAELGSHEETGAPLGGPPLGCWWFGPYLWKRGACRACVWIPPEGTEGPVGLPSCSSPVSGVAVPANKTASHLCLSWGSEPQVPQVARVFPFFSRPAPHHSFLTHLRQL